jgi:hypothetical protein
VKHYKSLRDLKVALTGGELPDGATMVVAREIVFLSVRGQCVFELSCEEFVFEALQLLGIPAEPFED